MSVTPIYLSHNPDQSSAFNVLGTASLPFSEAGKCKTALFHLLLLEACDCFHQNDPNLIILPVAVAFWIFFIPSSLKNTDMYQDASKCVEVAV